MSMPARRSGVYLDANATTPLDPGVRSVVVASLERDWGNPSSVHHLGREARVRLDEAREQLAARVGCRPSEIVFTSGGTEANHLAILGAARRLRDRGRHLVCSSVEHPAVLHTFRALQAHEGFTLSELPVDSQGRVDPECVRRSVRADTVLVSVMGANNEVGTLQPVVEIGQWCRERGVLFHCDAVQWFGKEPWPGFATFPADLVTLCPHKFHGPKGVGALLIRSPLPLQPVALGGSQELDRRAGTENLPAILGLVAAAEAFLSPPVFPAARLLEATGRLGDVLASIPGVQIVSPPTGRLANTLSFVVEGTDSIALLAGLDLEGIWASSGSACSAGSVEPSHVVRAMGYAPALAAALVRFSLSRDTHPQEVERVADRLPDIIGRCRRGC